MQNKWHSWRMRGEGSVGGVAQQRQHESSGNWRTASCQNAINYWQMHLLLVLLPAETELCVQTTLCVCVTEYLYVCVCVSSCVSSRLSSCEYVSVCVGVASVCVCVWLLPVCCSCQWLSTFPAPTFTASSTVCIPSCIPSPLPSPLSPFSLPSHCTSHLCPSPSLLSLPVCNFREFRL